MKRRKKGPSLIPVSRSVRRKRLMCWGIGLFALAGAVGLGVDQHRRARERDAMERALEVFQEFTVELREVDGAEEGRMIRVEREGERIRLDTPTAIYTGRITTPFFGRLHPRRPIPAGATILVWRFRVAEKSEERGWTAERSGLLSLWAREAVPDQRAGRDGVEGTHRLEAENSGWRLEIASPEADGGDELRMAEGQGPEVWFPAPLIRRANPHRGEAPPRGGEAPLPEYLQEQIRDGNL